MNQLNYVTPKGSIDLFLTCLIAMGEMSPVGQSFLLELESALKRCIRENATIAINKMKQKLSIISEIAFERKQYLSQSLDLAKPVLCADSGDTRITKLNSGDHGDRCEITDCIEEKRWELQSFK